MPQHNYVEAFVPAISIQVVGPTAVLISGYRGLNVKSIIHKWSSKVLSLEEKCLFLMYLSTLNSNMFPEFLSHPHLSRFIGLCEAQAYICESLGTCRR